jgi:hypothetical protein
MENYQSSSSVTTKSVGIRYGLILAVISILYFVVMNILGINMQQGVWQLVGMIPTIAVIFLAHQYFKEHGDGFMRYGQGLGIGTLVGVVSSVISSIFVYVYIKFVDQSFLETVLEKAVEDMQKQGLSDEQIDQAMPMVEKMTSAESILFMGILFSVFFAFIIALIVSIFTQKTNPNAPI